MSSSVPYIGSKISLISNSEIRYEGILYTIDTQQSTIALQSVRCFGTEGRKMPPLHPSNEVYDFIIFRGQDIKDLTVLDSNRAVNDPAIVSINQKPAGAGRSGAKGTGTAATGKGTGAGFGGQDKGGKGSGGGNWWSGTGGAGASSYAGAGGASGWGGWGAGGGGTGYSSGAGGYGSGGYGGWSAGGKGKGTESKGGKKGAESGKGKSSAPAKGGKNYGGKDSFKGGASKGEKGGGKKGADKGSGKKGSDKGGGKRGGGGGGSRSGGAMSGIPVGELQPEENADVKKECAEDFDVTAANDKFDKVNTMDGVDGVEDRMKPLSGYDKSKSFFDSISCEATERPAEAERPKADREKAREFDKETFGDTRRPPRPAGGRPGKGRRRGGGGKGFRS